VKAWLRSRLAGKQACPVWVSRDNDGGHERVSAWVRRPRWDKEWGQWRSAAGDMPVLEDLGLKPGELREAWLVVEDLGCI